MNLELKILIAWAFFVTILYIITMLHYSMERNLNWIYFKDWSFWGKAYQAILYLGMFGWVCYGMHRLLNLWFKL